MKIREYTSDDLLPVIAMWRESDMLRPWNDPEQDIARAMASPTATVLLGEAEGDLVASCMVGHDGHRGWLYYVCVSPNHRREGFGKEMVSAAEEWLKGQGAIKVMLMVRPTNRQVIDFYDSVGYGLAEALPLEKWLTPDGVRPTGHPYM